MLVMDGNMKNARQVCLCKNVGELQFSDLHGTVVVGKLKACTCDVHTDNPQPRVYYRINKCSSVLFI